LCGNAELSILLDRSCPDIFAASISTRSPKGNTNYLLWMILSFLVG